MRMLFLSILLVANSLPAQANPTYDDLHRLKTETYPDGSVVNYTYDPAGNLKQVEVIPAPTRDEDEDGMTDVFEIEQTGDNIRLEPDADKDGDGENNFAEFAFGTDPDSGSSLHAIGAAEPYFDAAEEKTYQQFTYQRRKDSGLVYTPAISFDLVNWQSSSADVSVITTSDNGDGTESVTVRSLVALEDEARVFFRVTAVPSTPQ